MGVEGLVLTPQLTIPVRDRDIQAMLLIDKNVSSCVDGNVWSKTGDYLFSIPSYFVIQNVIHGFTIQIFQISFALFIC